MEIWRCIDGYESYEVSNLGRVRNKYGKILVQPTDKDGYKTVSLCKNANQQTFHVHRLVAIAFIGCDNDDYTVDHKNSVKDDNRVENLQWMTRRENVQKYHREQKHNLYEVGHRRSFGKRGEWKRIPIIRCDRNGNCLESYASLMDAERKTGIGSGRISLCINGKKKSAGGFVWKKETNCLEVPERENRRER